MHGKDISIPKGTEITAYVNGDMKLDIAMFQQNSAQPTMRRAKRPIPQRIPRLANCEWNPTLPARISKSMEVLCGNTPSDVQVAEVAATPSP